MNTEKLMPIVPGCKAVIVNSKFPQTAVNIGREVTVVRRGMESDGKGFSGGWLIAAEGLMCGYRDRSTGELSFNKGREQFIAESRLMRIDGGDFADEFMRELTSDVDEIKRRIERC